MSSEENITNEYTCVKFWSKAQDPMENTLVSSVCNLGANRGLGA